LLVSHHESNMPWPDTAVSYLCNNATIEMKITKALTTGIAALAFAAPAVAATATLTAAPAQAKMSFLPCRRSAPNGRPCID
jgi:hypothetical protein